MTNADSSSASLVVARRSACVLRADCARLITAGRKAGSIPPGPQPKVLAPAVIGAVEGLMIDFTGRPPADVLLAERLVRGLLGLPPA